MGKDTERTSLEGVEFLNCNYPGQFMVPKGKPKELKNARFEMKLNKTTLIEQERGTVWFREGNSAYYVGIKLDLKHNSLKMIDTHATVSAVEQKLMDWAGQRLRMQERELLQRYLKMIR